MNAGARTPCAPLEYGLSPSLLHKTLVLLQRISFYTQRISILTICLTKIYFPSVREKLHLKGLIWPAKSLFCRAIDSVLFRHYLYKALQSLITAIRQAIVSINSLFPPLFLLSCSVHFKNRTRKQINKLQL